MDNKKLVPELRFPEFEELWASKKLENVCDVKGGKRMPLGHSLQKTDNGNPYITVSDFECGSVNQSNIRFVPSEIKEKIKRYTISSNDLYISVAGTLGLVGTIPNELNNANLTENANKLTNLKIDKVYLYYFLLTSKLKKLIHSVKTTSAQPKLAIYALNNFKLTVAPTNEEQQKIANFLTAIDQRITKLKDKKAALEDYKKGLMQKIFSQEIRFRPNSPLERGSRGVLSGYETEQTKNHDNPNEHPPMPPSRGEELSSSFPNWEWQSVKSFATLINGLTYSPSDVSENGLLVLRSSNVQNSKITYQDNVFVKLEVDSERITKPCDILLCVRNGSKRLIGKNAIIHEDNPKSTHGAFMTVLRGNKNKFLYQVLQTQMFFKEIHKNLGATINSINGSDLKKMKFMLPISEVEQHKIANFLSTIDQKINAMDKQIADSDLFKKGLLQRMFV